ncbi:MAG: ABC transporter substrate-binding protein [Hyphomicrobiaceae bacterium]
MAAHSNFQNRGRLGPDPQRNLVYYVSDPLAATTQGLVDLDKNMNIVPGPSDPWDISKDLTTYTYKLRKGVEYHNGRTVDAESVKWNYERIMDPKSAIHTPALFSKLQDRDPDK